MTASRGLLMLGLWMVHADACARDALVAVAANFSEVASRLVVDFEGETDHRLTVVVGSTGGLYARIRNGAPYDVLLAADQRRPELLEDEGEAVRGSRFTYALGRIVLWSADRSMIPDDGAALLRSGRLSRLAIANPDLAPYGRAAKEVLERLRVWDGLRSSIVMGENIGQTHALVATGNAQAGFVALSYVVSGRNATPGSRWIVPQNLYSPIRQDAVLLRHGQGNRAAEALVAYLRRDDVRLVIEGFGYGAGPVPGAQESSSSPPS